jgi:glycosyltransferase involved in cell wall biosynthesis
MTATFSLPLIAITMPVKNAEKTIELSILSFLSQKNLKYDSILIISDAGSTDMSIQIAKRYIDTKKVIVLENQIDSISENRNYLIEYVIKNFKNCYLIGRLDADDIFSSEYVLCQIEKIWEKNKFDVLFLANHHMINSKLTNTSNIPQENLLDEIYLYHRLKDMASGDFSKELPSCNLLINPKIELRYPLIQSAEDHWLFVFILMNKFKIKILISNFFYCNYSIDGYETKINKNKNKYLTSRLALLDFYKSFLLDKGYKL